MSPNRSRRSKTGSNYNFYVVVAGRRPGLYLKWEHAKEQIHGVSDSHVKGFKTRDEAEHFMNSSQQRVIDSDAAWHEVNENEIFTLHCDGATTGTKNNPHAAYGCVFKSYSGTIWAQHRRYIGARTFDEALYEAMQAGIHLVLLYSETVRYLRVHINSKLVVNQFNGVYGCRTGCLKPLLEEVRQRAKEFKLISFEVQHRDNYRLPHDLAKLAIRDFKQQQLNNQPMQRRQQQQQHQNNY